MFSFIKLSIGTGPPYYCPKALVTGIRERIHAATAAKSCKTPLESILLTANFVPVSFRPALSYYADSPPQLPATAAAAI
jgi:hypothetical protein